MPFLRGTPRSEKIKNLELKIKNLRTNIKEIIFTAINTEAFGYDTGESMIQLIQHTIINTTIPRISFGSIHPWSLDNKLYKIYKDYKHTGRLVNFFHVPIQSGSNKILNFMKRGYTKEEIMLKLIEIKRLNPLALIATDVIVGFLGETDKDFQDTYNFLKKSPISKFHIFRFSNRDNTAAHYMAKNLKEPSVAVKMKRAKLLETLGKKKYKDFLKKNVGRNSQALFISNREGDCQECLIDNQLPVLVKTTKNLNGQIKNIKILEYKKGKLFGRIVTE